MGKQLEKIFPALWAGLLLPVKSFQICFLTENACMKPLEAIQPKFIYFFRFQCLFTTLGFILKIL